MALSTRALLWVGAVVAAGASAAIVFLVVRPEPTGRAILSPTPVATTAAPTPAPTPASPPATSSATDEPTSPSASATSSAPDPREVPVESLLRPGTAESQVLYGDMNGDGSEEIALVSHAEAAPAGGGPAQPYLDVFAFVEGRYRRVFDATHGAPPGHGVPPTVIDGGSPEFNSQIVTFTDLVDLEGDGVEELVAGIEVEGATAGPLGVWVIGMDGSGFVSRFFEQTERDGLLRTVGDTIRLETGEYGPDDPGCCPSRISHQVIAFDPGRHQVRVVRETFTKNPGAA